MKKNAANAFPLVLDYLYLLWDDNTSGKTIMADNAVALHHTGRYFEIPQESKTLLRNNTTAAQTGTYLEHTSFFHDDQAYGAVVKKCCQSRFTPNGGI